MRTKKRSGTKNSSINKVDDGSISDWSDNEVGIETFKAEEQKETNKGSREDSDGEVNDVDEGISEINESIQKPYQSKQARYSTKSKIKRIDTNMDIKEVEEEIDEPADEFDDDEQKSPYLICVNPEYKNFYRMNLDTYKITHLHIQDEKLKRKFEKRIDKALKTIKRVEYSHEDRLFYWKDSKEAKEFRKRKYERYLLNRQAEEYPTNIIEKGESHYIESYNQMIVFNVNISEYSDLISNSLKQRFDTKSVGVS